MVPFPPSREDGGSSDYGGKLVNYDTAAAKRCGGTKKVSLLPSFLPSSCDSVMAPFWGSLVYDAHKRLVSLTCSPSSLSVRNLYVTYCRHKFGIHGPTFSPDIINEGPNLALAWSCSKLNFLLVKRKSVTYEETTLPFHRSAVI